MYTEVSASLRVPLTAGRHLTNQGNQACPTGVWCSGITAPEGLSWESQWSGGARIWLISTNRNM